MPSLAVPLPTMGRQSLWIDEAITAKVFTLGWRDLVIDRLGQGNFASYFLVLKAFGRSSETLLRPHRLYRAASPPACSPWWPFGWGPNRCLRQRAPLRLYASLIFSGQEAHPYTFMLLFLGIATYAQLELVAGRGRPRRLAILASIGAIGAALAVPSGAVTVAVQHVALWLAARRHLDAARRDALRRHIVATWVVIGLAALALLPSVFLLRHELSGWTKWQAGMAPGQRIAEAWSETYGFAVREDIDRFLPAGWETVPSLVFCALVAAGTMIRRREIAIRLLAGNVIGLPLVFMALGTVTVTAGRYLIGMLPSAILLAACAAAALLGRSRFRLPFLAIAAGAAVLLGLQSLDATQSDSRYGWRPLAAFSTSTTSGMSRS